METRIRWKATAVAVSMILLVPSVLQADEQVDARMQALEDRMRSLEDRLIASEATVAAQRERLEAEQTPDVAQGSALDAFFGGLEFGGHVAASYSYNFNNPDLNGGGVLGGGQPYFHFNTDHNTFSLDAVKLELSKPAAEPGSAGFQIDLLFGENANILKTLSPSVLTIDGRAAVGREVGDSNVFVQEAYVSYNYDGTEFKFGKFETLLGYEVLDSPYNPNITHGLLFTWAIPLFHTGILASGNLGESIEWAAGAVNGFNNASDYGDNKGVLGRLGWANDNLSIALNTFIGAEQTRPSSSGGAGVVVGDDDDLMQIYDLVATFTPNERLDLWLNLDYGKEDFSDNAIGDAQWWGVAAGFAYDISEKLSLAVRGEWFRDDGGTRLFGCSAPAAAPGSLGPNCVTPLLGSTTLADEIDMTSATVTLGYHLTENLLARLEYRHDTFDGKGRENAFGADFGKHDFEFDDQQDIGILEVNYTFD